MCDKNCFKNSIAVILLIFVFFFLFFKFGPKIPLSVITQQKGEPLMVSGTGKVSVAPDIAKVTLGIEETGQSLKIVQNSVNAKTKTLTDELKKLGIKEADIKTTNYSVYPEYNYESRPARITAYRVSVNYEVKVRDFEKVNEVLVKATDVGANTIGNIAFEVNDETKNEKLNEARAEAVKVARQKAEGLSKAAGISLGKLLNISESQGTEPRPIYALKEGVGSSTPVQPDIQPGETELSVTVTLSFEIR